MSCDITIYRNAYINLKVFRSTCFNIRLSSIECNNLFSGQNRIFNIEAESITKLISK